MMFRLAMMLLLTVGLAGQTWAGIYKWIDAEGQVHYGERPPADAQPLEVKPRRSPSEASVGEAKERWQGLIEHQERTSRFRQEDAAKAEEEEAAKAAEAKSQCSRARRRLELYGRQVRVFRTNDKGERVYLDDEERAREVAELEKFVQTYCR